MDAGTVAGVRKAAVRFQPSPFSICNALNQWMLTSAEKATGIAADFSSSLELTTDRVGRTLLSDSADSTSKPVQATPLTPDSIAAALNSGAAKNLHCPHPLPSGF